MCKWLIFFLVNTHHLSDKIKIEVKHINVPWYYRKIYIQNNHIIYSLPALIYVGGKKFLYCDYFMEKRQLWWIVGGPHCLAANN